MEETNKQHVQLPNDMTESLEPKDLLIYVTIKRFMNNETKEAFPSLQTLHKLSGAAINTIRASIAKLASKNYIEVIKKGKINYYKFNPHKNFEPFSYEFLDNQNLSFTEKAYLLASQQYMYKENGEGKISYTNSELSPIINMPESTISKCNRSLVKKDYLSEITTQTKSLLEGNCNKREKLFHLNKFGQAVVFALNLHEERINQNTEDIAKLKEQLASLQKDLQIALRENSKLKKEEEVIITM